MAFCHKCGKELPPESAFCPACGTPVTGTGPPRPASTTTFPQFSQIANSIPDLATTGDRAAAAIIDLIILGIASLAFAIPVGLLGAFGFGIFSSIFFGAFTLLWWLVWLVYFTFFEGTSGQTLGKQLVGITVVDESSRRPPPIEQALLRNILRIIDWLPFLYIIGFIIMETQPNKKRIGDMIARTVVIKA